MRASRILKGILTLRIVTAIFDEILGNLQHSV
jgi:hypothetical protein